MNLSDSSYLCLDIGTSNVSGIATRILDGNIASQKIYSFESDDKTDAINQVVEYLESAMQTRFDSAYITGDFGQSKYKMVNTKKSWARAHTINTDDIVQMVGLGGDADDSDFMPQHIIPLRYDTSESVNQSSVIGQSVKSLAMTFGAILVNTEGMRNIRSTLRDTNIIGKEYFDSSFLLGQVMRPEKEVSMFIDMGADHTTVSVWNLRGPMFYKRLDMGQSYITDILAGKLSVPWNVAEKIKRENISSDENEMDRFTGACAEYDFTRADVKSILGPVFNEMIDNIYSVSIPAIDKYNINTIYIAGGGTGIKNIDKIISDRFQKPVQNLGDAATVNALSEYVMSRIRPGMKKLAESHRRREKFINGIIKFTSQIWRKKPKKKFIPIMPSTLAFNMRDMATYLKFQSAGITMIHVDILDGLFVPDIYGGIDDLKFIRSKSTAHLNVHLMCESPDAWVMDTIAAGADTITISIESRGANKAWELLKKQNKVRRGVAIRADTPLSELKDYLKDADEVLIMSIIPGAIGRPFIPESIKRIESLAATRRRHKLKFKISVDGGIVPDTAKQCWAAGADFLVAGSYLKNAVDFPIAVNELLQR